MKTIKELKWQIVDEEGNQIAVFRLKATAILWLNRIKEGYLELKIKRIES